MFTFVFAFVFSLLFSLNLAFSAPYTPVIASPTAAVQANPVYLIESPYMIGTTLYTPKVDYDYHATGLAVPYGVASPVMLTANGEIFDPMVLAGAHPTLPLPSFVKVVHPPTGKSIVIRLNDRGAYPPPEGVVIALTPRVFEVLGFKDESSIPVEISILAAESRAIASTLPSGKEAIPPHGFFPVTPPPALAQAYARDIASLPPAYSPNLRFCHQDLVVCAGIFVQVASFKDVTRADSVINALTPYRVQAFISPILRDGIWWYRVRIGPLPDFKDARSILDSLPSYYDPVVVIEEDTGKNH